MLTALVNMACCEISPSKAVLYDGAASERRGACTLAVCVCELYPAYHNTPHCQAPVDNDRKVAGRGAIEAVKDTEDAEKRHEIVPDYHDRRRLEVLAAADQLGVSG